MRRCLDIDIGNFRTKWRSWYSSGWLPTGELPALETRPDRVRISMVSGSRELISSQSLELYGLVPEYAVSQEQKLGLTNAYPDPLCMGVDRWLALLAAWNQVCSSLAVIDAGTALTLDFVSAEGQHLGGYIVPGIATMHRQLQIATRDVSIVGKVEQLSELGPATDTVNAVARGSVRMLVEFIDAACNRHGNLRNDRPITVFLTGGDAPVLSSHLSVAHLFQPDLVLAGLKLAIP